jgi:hypothetical protein
MPLKIVVTVVLIENPPIELTQPPLPISLLILTIIGHLRSSNDALTMDHRAIESTTKQNIR